MHIIVDPPLSAVTRLLVESGLPTADIATAKDISFYASGDAQAPDAVAGLEVHEDVGLLRSLAVAAGKRHAGVGTALVQRVEEEARRRGVRALYLLTTSAEPFFARRGYVSLPRECAPASIRATQEFAQLCPATAVLMYKPLNRPPAGEYVEQTLSTADGATITARLFGAQGAAGVILVPAMGVAQPFYAPLAAWLAARGFVVLTFDYRGIGLSRSGSLRRLDANILDWARFDCAAALDALAQRVPGRPIYWIGHSLGGQILPLVPNHERVTKFVTIATGSGYWRENAEPLKRRAWVLWYVLVPLVLPLFGYFPGRALGIVGDLPAGVMRQWRRWCLHPEYAVGVEGESLRARYAALRTPVVSLSFTDDEFMSARNTESMHGFYAAAPRKMKRLAPADVGLARIGHFGFFRPEVADALWSPHLLPELA